MKLQLGMVATLLMLAAISASANAYTVYIKAPAVLFNEDTGILTTISLNVTPGSGVVAILGPSIVNSSTLDSAQVAAQYASNYSGVNESRYNFIYTIANASNVSGPSGGLALALLAVAALEGRQLPSNFSATGTINADGTVGQIGGVYDKVSAAKMGNMRFILVPSAASGSFEEELYYISQQQFNIPLAEVANVSQALGYVYGGVAPQQVNYNVAANYYQGSLPYANITCTNCNNAAFGDLANFTFNSTDTVIGSIGPEYQSLKSQMQGQESVYRQIFQKGYLYSASDLSFLLYTNAYTVRNSENITALSSNLLISNLSSYCSSLMPPPMTNLNYEYVIGGELRQSWGSVYAGIAQQQLNAAQTSDDQIQAVNFAGKANGWCKAANEMYSIASSLGGQYVQLPESVKANATSALNAVSGYGTSTLYYLSALNNYKAGNYAASLYASAYASAFYGSSPSPGAAGVLANLSSYNYGAWPAEFALQAQFYLYEAKSTGNQSDNASAYELAALAKQLSGYNRMLAGSFLYNATAPTTTVTTVSNYTLSSQIMQLSSEITQLQQETHDLFIVMMALLIILLAVLVLFLVFLLRVQLKPAVVHRRRRGRS